MYENLRNNRGTTLIEMLVIVGVITVLVTLIVPSLGVARLQAKRAVCMSNLHDIGVCTQMYWENHNGQFPQLFYYFEPGASNTIVILVVPKKAAVAGWTVYDPKSFICPSDPSPYSVQVRQQDDSIVQYPISYAFNVDFLLRDPRHDDLPFSASHIVMFFDGAHDGDKKGKKQGHYSDAFDFASTAFDARHLGKADILYVDGHVESKTAFDNSDVIIMGDPVGQGNGNGGNGNGGNGNGGNGNGNGN
ncbi:MAG: hypothetical protein HZA50_10410 [Planctomycetes bacterium]|nr:hypothetical protein [Planctomycetota bacterium]